MNGKWDCGQAKEGGSDVLGCTEGLRVPCYAYQHHVPHPAQPRPAALHPASVPHLCSLIQLSVQLLLMRRQSSSSSRRGCHGRAGQSAIHLCFLGRAQQAVQAAYCLVEERQRLGGGQAQCLLQLQQGCAWGKWGCRF